MGQYRHPVATRTSAERLQVRYDRRSNGYRRPIAVWSTRWIFLCLYRRPANGSGLPLYPRHGRSGTNGADAPAGGARILAASPAALIAAAGRGTESQRSPVLEERQRPLRSGGTDQLRRHQDIKPVTGLGFIIGVVGGEKPGVFPAAQNESLAVGDGDGDVSQGGDYLRLLNERFVNADGVVGWKVG